MKSEGYEETPRGPLSQSTIKRNFFTLISKADFDKIFSSQNPIGSGAQGQVYGAFFDGQKVAIKYFRREALSPSLINYIQNEIQSLDEIRHRNIVSLICTYQVVISNFCKKFCLVTEYCESSLDKYEVIEALSDVQKLKICSEMVSGINAAHQKKIMHRDIKPDNILIKNLNTMEIKIADFGCSTMKEEGNINGENVNMTRCVGTPLYSDPNITGGRYSFKCDVYSAGLVIIYIFCGQQFFSNCNSLQELKEAKEKFTKDIIGSARDFLQNFTDEEVSPRAKAFLVEIAAFTMENEEKDRHSAADLLEFINNQLTHFKTSDLNRSELKPSPKKYPQVSDWKKNKFNSEAQIGSYEKSVQWEIKLKKYTTSQQNCQDSFHSLDRSYCKSQMTYQTTEPSEQFKNSLEQGIQKNLRQDISFQRIFSICNQKIQTHPNDQSFDDLPYHEFKKDLDSLNKSQLNQNSFISSDSDEISNKWNRKEKSLNSSIKMVKNPMSSSVILENRVPSIKSRQSIEDQSLRQSRINQKEKTLDETEKLCCQLIRYVAESSGINQQGELMHKILNTFISIKKNFETIRKLEEIIESPIKKEQKVTISFFFHFLYAAKLKDIRSFVLGQPTNLKLEFSKISSKKKESICKIVESQLERIFGNLKNYSTDLRLKVDLMRPRLSEFTRNCINDAFKCTVPGDLLKLNFKETEIKQETRNFIKEKQSVTKNDREMEILNDLTNAIGKMCQ